MTNRIRRQGERLKLGAWTLANICLLLLFVFQYSYFMRDKLAGEPLFRPWLERVCVLAGCELPLQQDFSKIDIVSREVRSHPNADSALLINATLVNKARFTQPFPDLRLSLSDVTGSVIAQRRFPPQLYLSKKIDIGAGIAPQTPIQLTLEIVDPGKNVVGFEFDLLPASLTKSLTDTE